ncbi:MAG: AMP-binding protein [Microthrixaceae bacterium]|nr:AMP-binding protein [Microthrixaceae bacterium]
MTQHGDRWNLATVWEAVADSVGDAPAQFHGGEMRSWSELEAGAARFAGILADRGIGHDAKVALALYNGIEYVEASFGCFKARAVPVNVNYRYTAAELAYLLDNSDAEAIVLDSAIAPAVGEVLAQLPKIRLVLQVGDGELIGGGLRYSEANATADPAARIDRSVDDLWFLYTGGTTGMPKGVMWPQGNLFETSAPTFKAAGEHLPADPAAVGAAARRIHERGRAPRLLPAAPLMHGTSAISSWGALSAAGSIVTLCGRSLDAVELLDAAEAHRVTNLTIVGDAFAKPIVAALEADEEAGRRRDLSSLGMIVSSGVMWSQPVKDALLERLDVALADLVGSSEGVGGANSVSKRGRSVGTAKFRLGENSSVFTEDGREVEPGSEESGLIAIGGPIPIGYYKDPDKTAATFRTFAGRRWSVPGDWARVEADGTIRLLGRGSVCINTAGEKVYPEEVEETLKLHPQVIDANVVGVDDEKWGQAVTAVVSLSGEVEAAELVAHCRRTLAGYKCPKHVVAVERVPRGPNGKADYRWAAQVAAEAVSFT